jgi:hypothetical protein
MTSLWVGVGGRPRFAHVPRRGRPAPTCPFLQAAAELRIHR